MKTSKFGSKYINILRSSKTERIDFPVYCASKFGSKISIFHAGTNPKISDFSSPDSSIFDRMKTSKFGSNISIFYAVPKPKISDFFESIFQYFRPNENQQIRTKLIGVLRSAKTEILDFPVYSINKFGSIISIFS